MQSSPESERLAWERVGALEAELKRTRAQASRAIDVLRAWSVTLQRTPDGSMREALRSNGVDTHKALEVLAPAFKGLAMALDESADKLLEQLSDG